MAQTLTPAYPLGQGWAAKLKIHVLRLANTAGETTYTLTAALAGMTGIYAVIGVDEVATAAVRHVPTVGADGLYSQVALTFTAGDEINLLVIGV